MHPRSLRRAALVAAALAAHAPLAAQTPAPTPPPAAAGGVTPIRVGPLVVSGSLRLRAEGWDWFDAEGFDDDYALGASLLRVAATYSNPRVDVQVELSQPTLLGLPDHAVAPAPQGQLGLGAAYRASNGERMGSVFLKQGFVRLKGVLDPANSVRVGRVEFWEGAETTPASASLAWVKRERVAHRLIGNFGFSHVQRSFDAVQLVRNTRRANLTLLAGFPTQGVFELDGMPSLTDIDLEYAALTLPARQGEARLFAIRYRDGRGITPTDNRPAALRTAERERSIEIGTLGGHLLRAAALPGGAADLLLWGAVQRGDWTSQEHRAHAYAAELGYQPRLPLRPWIRAGYLRGSGDDAAESATGGEHGSFFQLLPTPRIYARTPFHNLMNSEDRFVQLLLRPDAATTLRADFHSVRLTEGADLWYAGGGAFDDEVFGFQGRPAGGERELASLLDLSLDRTFGPLTATLYLGNVDGGAVVSRLHPGGAAGRFAYLELSRRF